MKNIKKVSIKNDVENYRKLKIQISLLNEQAKALLEKIAADCGNESSIIGGSVLKRVETKTVCYKQAFNALMPHADLSDFVTHSVYWRIQ